MCKDSVKDDWIYIVKQGACRVLKTVRLNSNKEKPKIMYIELKKLLTKDAFVSYYFSLLVS